MSRLTVVHAALHGIVRKLQVHIDDAQVGLLSWRERREFEVAPGSHSVFVKMDWCESRPLVVQLAEGQTRVFECKGSLAYRVYTSPRDFFSLRELT